MIPLGYANVSSIASDPIEKKPLYHFFPGTMILSIGGFGCNLKCDFCQNYSISRSMKSGEKMPPADLIDLALSKGATALAYTYNEPLINFEYILDCASLARKKGLKNVIVSNGYLNEAPLRELLPFLDGANIDLKGDEFFYQKLCKGHAAPVIRNLNLIYHACHLEVTTLIVTHGNDTEKTLDFIIDTIAEISKTIPLHLSRYFPRYKSTAPETPEQTMHRLYRRAAEKLTFVYLGNIQGDNDTRCPHCHAIAVSRNSGRIETALTKKGKCAQCGGDLYMITS